MDPIYLLKNTFPVLGDNLLQTVYGGNQVRSASEVGPSVIQAAAARDPSRNSSDAEFLDQMSSYRQVQEQAQLRELTASYGVLSGGDSVHAIAQSDQAVRVGDDSVVDVSGRGDVIVGSDSTVNGGRISNTVHLGDRSLAVGGRGRDVFFGADNVVGRGGYGRDIMVFGDGSMASGDMEDDQLRAGRLSILDGGRGNDRLTAGAGSTISGGDDDDVIKIQGESEAGPDRVVGTIEGGRGDDAITVDNTAADIVFRAGDGSDIVYGDLGYSNIVFKDYRHTDVEYQRQGQSLVIQALGTYDSVTIYHAASAADAGLVVSFRGGESLSLSDILEETP